MEPRSAYPRQPASSPTRCTDGHAEPPTLAAVPLYDELLGGRHIAGHHEGGEPEPRQSSKLRRGHRAIAASQRCMAAGPSAESQDDEGRDQQAEQEEGLAWRSPRRTEAP